MKAIRLNPPYILDNIAISEVAEPGQPGPGEIRVRIHASSLNWHDYAVAKGWLPTEPGRIPLADSAGVVEAIGPDVTDFKVGDSVVSCFSPLWQDGEPAIAGFGSTPGDGFDGFAREHVVLPAIWFTRAPAGFSHAEAATLTTAGLTAWRAVVAEGGVKAGDSVLVLGSGGVSVFALQIAKAMGATVAATSSSEEKLQRLKALGADHLVNYKRQENWAAGVLDWTGGRGVDHVIEVGGPATLGQSVQAVRVGGHISMIGVLTGFAGEVPIGTILQRQIRMKGITVGSRRQQMDFVRGLEATGIRPVIDSHFPLEQLGAAFKHEEAGAHFGKICVRV